MRIRKIYFPSYAFPCQATPWLGALAQAQVTHLYTSSVRAVIVYSGHFTCLLLIDGYRGYFELLPLQVTL